jgi:hypothetical protein
MLYLIKKKKKTVIERPLDLAPKGINRTIQFERNDFNSTFKHIYDGIRNIK